MIEVKDLTFSYGKDKQALHGLDRSEEHTSELQSLSC